MAASQAAGDEAKLERALSEEGRELFAKVAPRRAAPAPRPSLAARAPTPAPARGGRVCREPPSRSRAAGPRRRARGERSSAGQRCRRCGRGARRRRRRRGRRRGCERARPPGTARGRFTRRAPPPRARSPRPRRPIPPAPGPPLSSPSVPASPSGRRRSVAALGEATGIGVSGKAASALAANAAVKETSGTRLRSSIKRPSLTGKARRARDGARASARARARRGERARVARAARG